MQRRERVLSRRYLCRTQRGRRGRGARHPRVRFDHDRNRGRGADASVRHVRASTRGVLTTPARSQCHERRTRGSLDLGRVAAPRLYPKVFGPAMNRRFDLRAPWVSRVLILFGFAAAVSLAACEEKLEAGAACPILCSSPNVALKDTTVEAVAVDSSLPGFPPIGEESPLLLAARGDTLDTRVIFRFDSIGNTFPHPSAPGDTIVTHVDSATLR